MQSQTAGDLDTRQQQTVKQVIPVASSARAANPLLNVLAPCRVRDLIATASFLGKDVISLKSSDTIGHALSLMHRARILSLPVLAEVPSKQAGTSVCQGFVDVLGIVGFFLASFPSKEHARNEDIPISGFLETKLSMLLEHIKPPVNALHIDSSALSAVELLSKKGVNRVALFDESQALVGVCSQSDVVRFLCIMIEKEMNSNEALRSIANTSVEKLSLGASEVKDCCVPSNASLMVCMEKLAKSKGSIGSVALTDDNCCPIANFSASDCYALCKTENFKRLYEPALSFLQSFSPKSLSPIVYGTDATLLQIMQACAKNHIHNVWLSREKAQGKSKISGVISLADICNLVCTLKQE